MKVLISQNDDFVSGHFGHSSQFIIFDILNNKIIKRDLINNPGHKPGLLPHFFYEKGINLVITGSIGFRAIDLFKQFNINVIFGVQGQVDSVIEQFLKGVLRNGENTCSNDGCTKKINSIEKSCKQIDQDFCGN